MNALKGWKTILYNVIMAILLIVESQGLGWGLDQETITSITIGGNFIIRIFFTDSKVFSSIRD